MNWCQPQSLQFASLRSYVFFLLIVPLSGFAQPSGGPYGPIQQNYVVTKDAAHVYYVSPDGKTSAPGETPDQPTTLESVIARVVTGDAIILRGGTYRTGGLKLNQGITMQPYADEHPVLKGTQVATNWEALRDNVWRTSWSHLFPQKPADWWRRNREGMRTPLHRFNNDMVFVDGRMLQSAGWEGELDTNTFSIDYEHGHVFLGQDPTNHVIEITVFDSALVRTTSEVHGKKSDGKGPIIRGITFTQYAYRALEVEGKEPEGVADPSTFGKDVVGTTLENVTITYCSRVAGYFRGDKTIFRNCLISDTSTEGIYLIASSDCLLERNIFRRNNIEKITGYYPSAVKIFNQTYRVVCRDNLVIDQPDSNGIWYDVGNHDGVFINNWVEGCIDGFFFEISKGAICAGNVFVNCDEGVRILNSTNAAVYHNTFVNTVASFERTERSAVADHFGWHPSTGPDVGEREGHVFVGNLIVADENFHKPLLRFEQTKVLCGKLSRPQVTRLDDNVYVRSGDTSGRSLLVWSPVEGENCVTEFKKLEELRRLHPEYEAHSLYLPDYYGSVFKSPELQNYELTRSFPKAAAEDSLPAQIQQLLGWPKQDSYAPGAYQEHP
jgi:parallel beta-helix repeat protein